MTTLAYLARMARAPTRQPTINLGLGMKSLHLLKNRHERILGRATWRDMIAGNRNRREIPNPLFPASGLATGSFNGLHTKSKFLAVRPRTAVGLLRISAAISSATVAMARWRSGWMVNEMLILATSRRRFFVLFCKSELHGKIHPTPSPAKRRVLVDS